MQLDTIVAERAGVLTFGRAYLAQVDQLVALGRIDAESATILKDRIRAFADAIGTGLHRDGADPAGVREAMRSIVKAQA